MKQRCLCVYILASGPNGTLYTGVTSDLPARLAQHRAGAFDGSTKRFGVTRLVCFEVADRMDSAIAREKQIKRDNPAWNDMAAGLGLAPFSHLRAPEVDPGTRPG